MQYAVVVGFEVCIVAKNLARAEVEREFFSSRFGKQVDIVTLDEDNDASARLQHQLALRNARDEM
ncbi:hypothetical protein [Rhizobium sp. Root1220]|uniref:hypothetical protein n=1 Tax=Rhizobium sp. Root1220 TaxID=1736432 RepID=UPI0006F35F0A|nr:hypothetical protein [Rhizobium sp. Root1220]KQV78165.1 hypothetical protein ASC90_26945 [Rhizobium sp. Root1220]